MTPNPVCCNATCSDRPAPRTGGERLRRGLHRVLAAIRAEAMHMHHIRELRGRLFEDAIEKIGGDRHE